MSVLDFLSVDLGRELADRRRCNQGEARLDESTLLPAYERYDGSLYAAGRSAIRRLTDQGARVLIISGGYGLVLAGESIGMYEQMFRPGMWPDRLIERCLAGFAEVTGARHVIGILSATTGYATVFRRTPWPDRLEHVILVSPEATTGAMVKAPRAQGEWLATLAEHGGLPKQWSSSDGLRMEITPLAESDANIASRLVGLLGNEDRAESPGTFPRDRDTASHPGLYSWWADAEARALIGDILGIEVPALIYAGQAGATNWPSGTKSTASLASRIGTGHIGSNASSSTFRLTLSALLLEPLGLEVARPGRLTLAANRVVSDWIKTHLKVAVAAYDDRDTLGRVEHAVLDLLDPPLNLDGRPPTVWRRKLTGLRRHITRPS